MCHWHIYEPRVQGKVLQQTNLIRVGFWPAKCLGAFGSMQHAACSVELAAWSFNGAAGMQHAARRLDGVTLHEIAEIKYLFVRGRWEFVPFIWLRQGHQVGRGGWQRGSSSTSGFGVFRLPIPELHFGNFCKFMLVCLQLWFWPDFGQTRAHPFYIQTYHIWRNQKSLLLIKTYFTARFCFAPQPSNGNANSPEERKRKNQKIPLG